MRFRKTENKAVSEEIEQLKAILKNIHFEKDNNELTEKKQREISDRVITDMLADIEEEKTKFHFKRTKEKLAREEAELKRMQLENRQKLQDLQ